MKFPLLHLFILLAHFSNAQENIRLELTEETTYSEEFNIQELYVLPDSQEVLFRGEVYTVEGTSKLQGELAFSFEFTGGRADSAVPYVRLMIVENYKSASPKLYIDSNGNLDISDDGAGLLLEKGAAYKTVGFPVGDGGNREVMMRFISHLHEQSEISDEMVALYSGSPSFKGNQVADKRFWLGKQRQVIKSANLKSEGLQIGIMDLNNNGIYNDSIDMMVVGEYGATWLSAMTKDGAIPLEGSPLIQLGNQVYELAEVAPDGTSLNLHPTDKELKDILSVGDLLPDMNFELIDGTKVAMHDFIEEGKYTLIDNWATWCRGCVSRIAELKSLLAKHDDRLNMIGLAVRDSPEKVKTMVDREGISWQNGMITPEIMQTLMVEGYPYLVLVNDKAEVMAIGLSSASEIEEIITRH